MKLRLYFSWFFRWLHWSPTELWYPWIEQKVGLWDSELVSFGDESDSELVVIVYTGMHDSNKIPTLLTSGCVQINQISRANERGILNWHNELGCREEEQGFNFAMDSFCLQPHWSCQCDKCSNSMILRTIIKMNENSLLRFTVTPMLSLEELQRILKENC